MKSQGNGGTLVPVEVVAEVLVVNLKVVVIPGKSAYVSKLTFVGCQQPENHFMWQQDWMFHIEGS